MFEYSCPGLFFQATVSQKKLYDSAGFELDSSQLKATTLNTGLPPRPHFAIIYIYYLGRTEIVKVIGPIETAFKSKVPEIVFDLKMLQWNEGISKVVRVKCLAQLRTKTLNYLTLRTDFFLDL